MAPMKRPQGKQKQKGGKKKFSFKGLKLLGVVALLYLVVFMLNRPKAIESLGHFSHVMGTLVPILAVVMVLTALVNFFLDPKTLAKHLGEESGLRGWMIALGAGVLSHGPMYAWYPMIQELREKGARDGLIITFFYARAVKLALLPVLVAYFGIVFAVTLTVLTLIAAWLQGVAVDRFRDR